MAVRSVAYFCFLTQNSDVIISDEEPTTPNDAFVKIERALRDYIHLIGIYASHLVVPGYLFQRHPHME